MSWRASHISTHRITFLFRMAVSYPEECVPTFNSPFCFHCRRRLFLVFAGVDSDVLALECTYILVHTCKHFCRVTS